MKHTYQLTGITCGSCEKKVINALTAIPDVKGISIDRLNNAVTIEMDKHVGTESLQLALKEYPKYQLSDIKPFVPVMILAEEEKKSWLATYKPILLIFGYIVTLSVIFSSYGGYVNIPELMRLFMSGFFLVFSFFKMLDLNGFADSYSMYDIVAKKIRSWGYIYAFIELTLGIAFALNIFPLFTNTVTLIVMSVSIIGVLQSVLNKRKIKCACLGAVFNLPMSTITIIEDALMIIMSALMLIQMI